MKILLPAETCRLPRQNELLYGGFLSRPHTGEVDARLQILPLTVPAVPFQPVLAGGEIARGKLGDTPPSNIEDLHLDAGWFRELKTQPRGNAKAPPITEFVREFQFADGDRPITVDKRNVAFCCPLKDDPENKTLVGWRSSAGPVPLRVSYSDFRAWWLEEGKSPASDRA